MTTEEIVLSIQAGENCYEELWERVKRFIYKRAFSYSLFFSDSTIEIDDLAQGGYLALVEAIGKYDPEAGGFLTLLHFYLRKTWREMYGLRGRKDALDNAISFDAPIDDDEETPMLDTIPDPAAAVAFAETDEQIYRDELRAFLEKALDAAPHGDVMRRKYFQGQTGKQIADDMGVSVSCVHQYERDARRYLRQGPYTRGLLSFDFYHGTGLQSWKDNGSIQERYLLFKEKLEGKSTSIRK